MRWKQAIGTNLRRRQRRAWHQRHAQHNFQEVKDGFDRTAARAPKPRGANGGDLHHAAVEEESENDEEGGALGFEAARVGGREEKGIGAKKREMEREREKEQMPRGGMNRCPR